MLKLGLGALLAMALCAGCSTARSPLPANTPANNVVGSSQAGTNFKPGEEVLASPGSVLLASPMEGAAVVQSLSPSPLLKLENSIVNSTGEWWFVSSDIERGWLRGDRLIRP